jgi:hypothetical protein
MPGRKIDMSMVYKDLPGPISACPGCGADNTGFSDEEIKWYEFCLTRKTPLTDYRRYA